MSGEGPCPHPSPPGWHSSLMKHSHKSRLPPRPTLGHHQGPGNSPHPHWEWAGPKCETPLGAYPQCSGFPRGRTLCKLGLSLRPWLGTHGPALAGNRWTCFLGDTCLPTVLSSLHTCLIPPQSCSERARCALRSHSSPRGMRTGPAFSGKEVDKKWPEG